MENYRIPKFRLHRNDHKWSTLKSGRSSLEGISPAWNSLPSASWCNVKAKRLDMSTASPPQSPQSVNTCQFSEGGSFGFSAKDSCNSNCEYWPDCFTYCLLSRGASAVATDKQLAWRCGVFACRVFSKAPLAWRKVVLRSHFLFSCAEFERLLCIVSISLRNFPYVIEKNCAVNSHKLPSITLRCLPSSATADVGPGLAIAQAEERKRRTYPKFGQRSRCRLVVFALEVRGAAEAQRPKRSPWDILCSFAATVACLLIGHWPCISPRYWSNGYCHGCPVRVKQPDARDTFVSRCLPGKKSWQVWSFLHRLKCCHFTVRGMRKGRYILPYLSHCAWR